MKSRQIVLLVCLLAVVGLGYWGGHRWMQTQLRTELPVEVIAAETCMLSSGSCEVELGGSTLRFSFDQPPVPLEPFILVMETAAELQGAEAEFQMRDMYMGFNRFPFERIANTAWRARVVLPVCVAGRSDWVAVVRIWREDGVYVVQLPFEVINNL